jgi:hypothetical protein
VRVLCNLASPPIVSLDTAKVISNPFLDALRVLRNAFSISLFGPYPCAIISTGAVFDSVRINSPHVT